MRRVLLLAACSALVLPAVAQDGFASLPRDPALAYTAHPDDFRELLPYTVPVDDERGEVRLRAHALRYTWQPPETVEIQADLYEESDRWEGSAATPSTYITMTVGLGEAPPPPEDAKQVQVGGYEGRLGRERGDAVLWVMPAPRRWVRTTHLDTTAGPLVAAVEAVGLDALAALPAETSVWADPLTRTAYQTLFDYWTAHPALVWGRQATPAAVVQAFPEAPLGTYRVIGEASFEDRAPRWSARRRRRARRRRPAGRRGPHRRRRSLLLRRPTAATARRAPARSRRACPLRRRAARPGSRHGLRLPHAPSARPRRQPRRLLRRVRARRSKAVERRLGVVATVPTPRVTWTAAHSGAIPATRSPTATRCSASSCSARRPRSRSGTPVAARPTRKRSRPASRCGCWRMTPANACPTPSARTATRAPATSIRPTPRSLQPKVTRTGPPLGSSAWRGERLPCTARLMESEA